MRIIQRVAALEGGAKTMPVFPMYAGNGSENDKAAANSSYEKECGLPVDPNWTLCAFRYVCG